MKKPLNLPPFDCPTCDDVGSFIAFNTDTNRYEVQRCDNCSDTDDFTEWLLLVPISEEKQRKRFIKDVRTIMEVQR